VVHGFRDYLEINDPWQGKMTLNPELNAELDADEAIEVEARLEESFDQEPSASIPVWDLEALLATRPDALP
jgi:hypothetical protein